MSRRLFFLAILVGLFLLPLAMLAFHSSQSAVPANDHSPATVLSELSNLPAAVTDAEGRFLFSSVPLATHLVYLIDSTLPDQWKTSLPENPVKLMLNPGMATSGRVTPWVVLEARYQDDAIAGVVFADLDQDGQMGAGDLGLAGVTVVDPGIHQYFVPFDDDHLQTMFADINENTDCYGYPSGSTSNILDSIISLTASADGTQWFYDHWEDGYDPDPTSPVATTTTSGTLNTGESTVWPDAVITPRDSNPECEPGRYCNDGRDRITVVGEAGTLIRASWPIIPDSRLAGAWEIWEVAKWDHSYIVPVGEDLGSGEPDPPDYNDFDWVGLQVMSAVTTTISIDNDGDDIVDITETLPPGECYAIMGDPSDSGVGINSGATVTADAPVQVQLLTGACDSPYAARAYTLIPTADWSNDYYSPVPSLRDNTDFPVGGTCAMDPPDEANQTADVAYYIFNPNPTAAIDVDWETADASGIVNIPANETFVLGPDTVPVNSPVHLTSTDNFWSLAVVDSALNYGASQDFDWGFTVLPLSRLSPHVILGWAPGHDEANVPPDQDNGNLVFVTPITDTIIYVDLNNDGTLDNFDSDGSGALENPNAYGINEMDSENGVPVNRLRVLRVSDHTDNDLNGALIHSSDLAHYLAVVWGQDGCQAKAGTGYLDLGYTVLPIVVPIVAKVDDLAVDADSSGDISPGDTLTYTVIIENNGFGTMTNVVLTDDLPHDYVDFVLGSIASTRPYQAEVYDDGSGTFVYPPTGAPGTPDPNIQAFRLTWNTIDRREIVTVTFRVVIQNDIPVGVSEICNVARVDSDNTNPAEVDTCRLVTQQQTPTPTATPTTTGTPPTPTSTATATPTASGTPPTSTPTPTPPPPNEIPEPLTVLLMGSGLAALASYIRHRRRR